MIKYRREGEPISNGVNIYPQDDPSSKGAVVKLGFMLIWCRFSQHTKKWLFKVEKHLVGRLHNG